MELGLKRPSNGSHNVANPALRGYSHESGSHEQPGLAAVFQRAYRRVQLRDLRNKVCRRVGIEGSIVDSTHHHKGE